MTPPDHDERQRMTARIDELESRLAQQDQTTLELSDEVYRQQLEIARLATEVRRLVERVRILGEPQTSPDAADEVPPHY
jgi:SlyX protein